MADSDAEASDVAVASVASVVAVVAVVAVVSASVLPVSEQKLLLSKKKVLLRNLPQGLSYILCES